MNRRPSLELDEVVESLGESSSRPFSLAAKGSNVFNDGQSEQGGGIGTIVSDAAIPISQTQERVEISSETLNSPRRRPNFSLSPEKRARLHGHILICGPFDQSYELASYLNDLHSREAPASEPRPTIVLLVKTFPSDDDFAAVPQELHANVFIERGVSQNVEDLLRVRAYDAASVLLMPGNWDEGGIANENEDVNDHLQDYRAIMSTLSLRTMQELHHEHLRQKEAAATRTQVNVALSKRETSSLRCSVVKSHESIKYFAYKIHGGLYTMHGLQNTRSDGEDLVPLIKEISDNPHDEYHDEHLHIHHGDYKRLGFLGSKFALESRRRRACEQAERLLPPSFTPGYAAGEVFVDCVLDTLLCQSFFNPYAVDLIRALSGDYYSDISEQSSPQGEQKSFKASMMRYFSNVSSASTASASVKSVQRENSSQPPTSQESWCQYPALRTTTITCKLEGESFAHIFSRALSQQIVVLGIYRRANATGRGNVLPYVVMCPDSTVDCQVEKGDQLHVLTRRPAPVCIQ